MNFSDLDLALETLFGEISMKMVNNISERYKADGNYLAVALAFENNDARGNTSNPFSKQLYSSIKEQWENLSDAEKYILLKYSEETYGEAYRGYEDIKETIYSTLMDCFYDFVRIYRTQS